MKIFNRKINSSFLVRSLGLFLFFVSMQLTTWLPLRYWHIWGGGNFIDMQQILQWSKCYEIQGNLVFENEGECSGYIYGSTLLKILSFLKVGATHTQIFGYLFMLILATTISVNLNNLKNHSYSSLIMLIVISPPVLLLSERGNFDILIFALIFLAGLFFSKDLHFLALIPLALATLLKFYSFPLFLLFFILSESKKLKLLTLVVGTPVFIRVLLDLQLIQTSFPSGYSWKFGASIWTRYLTQLEIPDSGEVVNNISGMVILFFTVLITKLLLKRKNLMTLPSNTSHREKRIVFYCLFLIHLSCFLLGMNFDYRLIFLAMASIIYLTTIHKERDTSSTLVLVLTLISVWLTYPSTGLEPVGDFTTEILTVILAIRFLQLIKLDVRLKNAK